MDSGENPLPGLQTADFLLLALFSRDGKREIISLRSLLMRTLIPFKKIPPSWPNYLPKAPPANTITSGIRTSANEFGEDKNIQSLAMWYLV